MKLLNAYSWILLVIVMEFMMEVYAVPGKKNIKMKPRKRMIRRRSVGVGVGLGWNTTPKPSGWNPPPPSGWGPTTRPTTTRRTTTKRPTTTRRTTAHGWGPKTTRGWGPSSEMRPIIPDKPATDCCELSKRGYKKCGVYMINPTNDYSIPVFCDMTENGGGWTVLLKREPIDGPSTTFYLSKTSYEEGFGNPGTTYWLGLKSWVNLMAKQDQELKVCLETFDGEKYGGIYKKFHVQGPENDYLMTNDEFSGNMQNSLVTNQTFHAPDSDRTEVGCSPLLEAGWWFDPHDCYGAILTGKYKEEYEASKPVYDDEAEYGIIWNSVSSKVGVDGVKEYVSLKYASMKIRARDGCGGKDNLIIHN